MLFNRSNINRESLNIYSSAKDVSTPATLFLHLDVKELMKRQKSKQNKKDNVVISIHIRGMDKGYTCPFVSRMES